MALVALEALAVLVRVVGGADNDAGVALDAGPLVDLAIADAGVDVCVEGEVFAKTRIVCESWPVP